MSASLEHSPADILRQLLVNLGQGTDPDVAGDWPVYCSSEPSDPDNCITTYDTSGVYYGRSSPDGEVMGSFGFQVRVRSTSHPIGWIKSQEIQDALSQVNWVFVGIESAVYRIQGIVKIGDILPIGKDITRGTKRSIFTFNAQLICRKQ